MSCTTTLASTYRRAAHGLHRCNACGGAIPRGDRYLDVRVAGEGTVWTWREHALCAALHDWFGPRDDDLSWVGSREDLLEWWRQLVLATTGVAV